MQHRRGDTAHQLAETAVLTFEIPGPGMVLLHRRRHDSRTGLIGYELAAGSRMLVHRFTHYKPGRVQQRGCKQIDRQNAAKQSNRAFSC